MGRRRTVPRQVGLQVKPEVVVELQRVARGVVPHQFPHAVGLLFIDLPVPTPACHGALGTGDEAERRAEFPLLARQRIPRVTAVEVRVAEDAVGARVFGVEQTPREEHKPAVAERAGEGELHPVVSALASVHQGIREETVETAAGVDEGVAHVGRAPRRRRIRHGNVVEVLEISLGLHRPQIAQAPGHAHHCVQALGEVHVGVGRQQRFPVGGVRRRGCGVEVRGLHLAVQSGACRPCRPSCRDVLRTQTRFQKRGGAAARVCHRMETRGDRPRL